MDVKCVMILANDLPQGLAVNAAGVLAVSLGFKVPSLLPPDAVDGSGEPHVGLLGVPLPILVADRETIRALRVKASEGEDVLVVDFSDVAQHARTYEDYIATLATTPAEALSYLGVALYGPRKRLNKLVGNLPLYGRVPGG